MLKGVWERANSRIDECPRTCGAFFVAWRRGSDGWNKRGESCVNVPEWVSDFGGFG
jgi:hypothetical protein